MWTASRSASELSPWCWSGCPGDMISRASAFLQSSTEPLNHLTLTKHPWLISKIKKLHDIQHFSTEFNQRMLSSACFKTSQSRVTYCLWPSFVFYHVHEIRSLCSFLSSELCIQNKTFARWTFKTDIIFNIQQLIIIILSQQVFQQV